MSIRVCFVQTVKIKLHEFPLAVSHLLDLMSPLVFASANLLKHRSVVLILKFIYGIV